MAEFRWKRGDGDFAVRVDLETIRGVFQKGVVVEPGCKALLIVDGAHVETLQAGEYNEGGIAARLKNFDLTRSATAILVDVGDVEMRFTLPGLMTRDPMQIDVESTLVVQVDEPLLFFTNVMKGRTALTREELERRFGVEIQNALQEAIGRRTVEELNTDLALKQQFELAVDEHLKRTFSRAGFGFVQFRTIAYRYQGFDRIRGIREEVFLQVTEDEAKLAGRKRLFDVFDRDELQTVFEETRKLERQVAQQRERARIIRELNPLFVDEQKSVDEMEKFLLEVEKGKLLRAEELADYKRTLQEAREDAAAARKFLIRRVDLERELQYEEMRLLGREELELRLFEARGRKVRAEFDLELAKDRERRAHAREQALKDHQAALDVQLLAARNDADRARIHREIQQGQIEVYKLYKETQLFLDVTRQREEMNLRLEEEERRLKVQWESKSREAQLQREMIEALSKASVEAVLATAGEAQARIIADLKQTEALKNLSEEQVLAWAATKNPELVRALEKKYEGLGKQEIELLYRNWMMDKDKGRDQLAKTMQEMFTKALETQRDVSVAATGANRPTVVTGGGLGGPTVIGGGISGTGIFRCTFCGADLQPHFKVCPICTRPVAGNPPPGPEKPA